LGRKYTPPPEAPERVLPIGCALVLVAVACVFGGVAVITKWWWLLVFCVPGLITCLYWLHGKVLLLEAYLFFRKPGIAGVLVTSDSPNWNAYIEEHWLSAFGERFVVLNYSQRKTWERSLAVRLFSRFCGYEKNFCPAVVLLRGLRYPLVFRFFYAFRDHKHGNEAALRRLEARLFEELGLRGDGR